VQRDDWPNKVNELVANGQLADARNYLEELVESSRDPTSPSSLSQLTKLIEICYNQLNHNRANFYADKLQLLLKIDNVGWGVSLFFSYLVCLNFVVFNSTSFRLARFIKSRIFPQASANASWKNINSILFAKFWHNIRACAKFPLLQLSLCQSQEEKLLAVGLVGYCLSYSGHNLVGNKTIQHAVTIAKRRNYSTVVNQLNPHLAIGYGMAYRSEESFQVYDEMANSMELSPFYELVIAANKISLSLTEKNLIEAQKAIEKCFSQSFSLANTANHVQIYGGQAILFAILSKEEEALALIKKSKGSADICSAPLNYLFYYRLEALMWYALKNTQNCAESLGKAKDYCNRYGLPRWHLAELKRIELANRALGDNRFLRNKYILLLFSLYSLATFNAGLIRKGAVLVGKNIFHRKFSYWDGKQRLAYLNYYLKEVDESNLSHLGKTSLTIASAFIESCKSVASSKGLDSDSLEEQIRQSLPVTEVRCSSNQEEVVGYFRKKYGQDSIAVINEKTDKIRMKCEDNGFFICISSPRISQERFSEPGEVYVGILIPDMDIQSEELIEAFLRVMLSQYAFNRSILMLEEQKRLKVEQEGAINQTIAKTVQMLAHDVRRPFSMVQGILDVLASTDDPEDAQSFAIKHLPEIKRAIATVTNMLSDVIEVGTQGKLELQSMSPKALVESVLIEHFRYNETANVAIHYDYKHGHNVLVDVTKVARVLTNIVVNALQAMSFSGELRFATSLLKNEEGGACLQFTTGNSGSYIPESEIEKLFEPYYTKGKKSGTGLGLAIADKVIREHGGNIWCVSSEEQGTEFHFTLPLDSQRDDFEGLSFQHSNDIYRYFQPVKERDTDLRMVTDYDEENKFEQLAIKSLNQLHRDMAVLITDDEPFYRSILKEQLLFNPNISSKVQVTLSSSGEQTLRLCEEKQFDIIVMDVDFGPALANGFETVRELRKRDITSKVIIHSNRGALQYQSMSIEAGADLFIPKPMSRAVFLKIIVSVLQDMPPIQASAIS
jgi:signal transduction histidine kinase/ActR/RegA family two-component response regulator